MAFQEECCYIGRGEIFLRKCLTQAEIDAGVVSEFISVGNTEEFNISSEVNTIVKKNYISKCGGIECSYSSIDDVQINLTLCCYKDLNVGLALSGDCIEVPAVEAIPAGLLSVGPITIGADESLPFIEIPGVDQNQAIVVSVNGSQAAGFGLDVPTERMLNLAYDPVEGDVITVDYYTLGVEGVAPAKKFNLFSCNSDVYELQFRGCNAAKGNDGKVYTLNLHKVCFEPASEFQFITEEFGTIELTGRLLPDRTKTITDGTNNFPSEYGAWCIEEAV